MSTTNHIWTASQPPSTYGNSQYGTRSPSTHSTNFFNSLQLSHPHGVKLFRYYERRLHAAHEEKARLHFLRECDDELVLPVSIPTGDNLLQLPFPPAHRHALRERITVQRRGLGEKFKDVRESMKAYRDVIHRHL